MKGLIAGAHAQSFEEISHVDTMKNITRGRRTHQCNVDFHISTDPEGEALISGVIGTYQCFPDPEFAYYACNGGNGTQR